MPAAKRDPRLVGNAVKAYLRDSERQAVTTALRALGCSESDYVRDCVRARLVREGRVQPDEGEEVVDLETLERAAVLRYLRALRKVVVGPSTQLLDGIVQAFEDGMHRR